MKDFILEDQNGFLGAKLFKVVAMENWVMIKLAEFFAPKSFSYFFDKKYKQDK